MKKKANNLQQQINRIRSGREKVGNLDILSESIRSGSRTALSKGITLVESMREEDRSSAQTLLAGLLPFSGNSIRIGISGVPGAGKSTFIEAFGSLLCSMGRKVAVLAVDPSSEIAKGSILGDKTRMNELASNENAFIRPSPSGGNLGGVARRTRESIYLCEAAGFDTILIETVGVGQNETAVHHMVDLFLLIALAGSGDELQGIKRGITELADIILVNKADGENLPRAKAARQDLIRALHFLPERENKAPVEVLLCSALEKSGLNEIWQSIEGFEKASRESKFFESNRKKQLVNWLHDSLKEELWNTFLKHEGIEKLLHQLEIDVLQMNCSVNHAALELMKKFNSENS